MLRLLSLVFIFFSWAGFAAVGELKTSFSTVRSQGVLSSSITTTQQDSSSSTDFSLTSPTIASIATLNATVSNSIVDAKSFSIQGLRQSNVQVGLELNKGSHQVQLTHSQIVTESPIATKNYSFSYALAFYSKTSFIGFSLSESNRLQPAQTFIDPMTAATKNRPTSLKAQRQEFFYEQILSEKLRGHYRLIFGQRSEDRPDHSGIEIRHSYAFNNHWSTRFDLGYIAENQSQSLKDEKGYFNATWGELLLNYQPNLDWMIQAGLGTTFEREYQPSSLIANALTQVGTDTYLMKLIYQSRGWQMGLTSKYGISNTGYQSDSFLGEFSWEI